MPGNSAFAVTRRALRRASASAAVLLLLQAAPAVAQTSTKPAAKAAPVSTSSLSEKLAVCAACHGADGNSPLASSPSLAGQPKVFLEHQLIVIREGLRVIPQMAGLLDSMSDKDISAMAQHFAAQPLKPQPGEKNGTQFERGSVLAQKMYCASCHLTNYEGREQMPRLAGQREDYLVHSMMQFKTGQAAGRDTIMASALYGASEQDIRDMAHYLAHLK